MNLKILNKKQEGKNAFSLVLEKPKDFQFYAGQYLDIELPVKDLPPAGGGNTRAFTISSPPTEDFLMITTKKGVSEYKKFMENLKKGDTIKTSHPAGTFTLDESTPAVLICGGIGITPFRSIIKYVFDEKITTAITLIYSNSDSDFPFKKDLELWQKQLPNLTTRYVVTNKDGRLNQEKLLQLYPIPLDNPVIASSAITLYPIFYLAGSHSFVNDMEKILLHTGVDQANIRYDRFDGY